MNRCFLLALTLLAAACTRQSDLPKLFPVPNASLVDENAKPVRLGANRGYVTVYDFIFTNCAASCPMMTATMRRQFVFLETSPNGGIFSAFPIRSHSAT